MPRIRPPTVDEAPPEKRLLLEPAARALGAPPAPSGIQAYRSPILEANRGSKNGERAARGNALRGTTETTVVAGGRSGAGVGA